MNTATILAVFLVTAVSLASGADVDVRHNLHAAASALVEMKPYDRLTDADGCWRYERLIFTDTVTGTELRRIDWDRSSGNLEYSNRYPWNADGSAFKFTSWERRGSTHYFLADASGAALRVIDVGGYPRWGADPDWLYYAKEDVLMRADWRTGKEEALFRVPAEIQHGGRGRIVWNMALPGLVYYERAQGPDAPLYFVNLTTGDWTRIPITTDSPGAPEEDWLYSARLSKLRGTWWVGYSLNHNPHNTAQHPYQQRLSSLDGKIGLNRMDLGRPDGAEPQPLYSHGATSPDGKLECGYRGGIAVWDFAQWAGRTLVRGTGGGHICWMYQNDWFFAGTRGAPGSSPFASQLLKVYTHGTWYRVAYGNTINTEYVTNLFANTSPDGTKGAYMSSMLGPVSVYWCVIAYPEPPPDLSARIADGAVQLTWEQPGRAAELRGYNVYRSTRSGVGYERITSEPVSGQAYTDRVPAPERPWYYVVTSVEHSGLESRRYTAEAAVGADGGAPERLFVEAETGVLTAPVRENLAGSAANLLFVDYRDGEGEGRATWRFPTRNAGAHILWARVRAAGDAEAAGAGWALRTGDGVAVGVLHSAAPDWEWVRLETPIRALAGGTVITAVSDSPGLNVDSLLLTDDPGFTPVGRQRIDPEPPVPPSGLKLVEARSFDVEIAWLPVADAAYYQVYRGRSREVRPAQEFLVGSPARPHFVEWGLQADTDYWYCVAAVDAFGNQSAPAPALHSRTAAIAGGAVWLPLEAEQGTAHGPAKIVDEPQASGGGYVRMQAGEGGDGKEFPSLDIAFDAPVAGQYVVWLRLCPVSNRGYAYLHAALDGGHANNLLCRFPTRAPDSGFAYTNIWRCVYDMRRELPVRFDIEPGRHTLRLSESHMQEFGIDQVIVTNDLGRRPAGRIYEWLYDLDAPGPRP